MVKTTTAPLITTPTQLKNKNGKKKKYLKKKEKLLKSNEINKKQQKLSKKEKRRLKREQEEKWQALELQKEEECKKKMKLVKYFIVVDLEWTCYNPIEKERSEIIEIGCQIVKYLPKQQKLIDVADFQQYVKPVINSKLTKICKELTGIQQETVDKAPTFKIAWEKFLKFLDEHKITTENARFVTWGTRDFNPVIPDALEREEIQPPKPNGYPAYFDLQYEYSLFTGKYCPFFKLSRAIEECKLDFSQFGGQHHSAIVDAKSEAGIFKKMVSEGWDPYELVNNFEIKNNLAIKEKKEEE
ncbi:hypothetical protein BCR36DRAFT_359605 [Piromyces finnis]|uniref:Exonuclease domain-containing protein n=1 Tax=Piromyces finnis TaxID=1754191 RepID=A0A1Y1V082_9FUNG|nr:hypothetical protein BCR36DRAFT_359605 [Piromyces finnis]|eukprot:ORX44498.1 hypothetical protein BCR36DRAFT_359605 [Piromyces finnis]